MRSLWLSQYKKWGFDAKIEEFYVLFPTPKYRKLEMIYPQKFTAKLMEPALKEDSTSDELDEQLPTYNAYSADGDVTAELVYVNFGVPADYDVLCRTRYRCKRKNCNCSVRRSLARHQTESCL